MSWFDATGFANLAKTALKEAQKTIDKALDINEEDIENKSQRSCEYYLVTKTMDRMVFASELRLLKLIGLQYKVSLYKNTVALTFRTPTWYRTTKSSKK